MLNIVSTDEAPKAIGSYSQAVSFDKLLFTSGQIPLNKNGELVKGDIKAQTRQVLLNLENVLKEGGSSLEGVLKTTVFVSNIDDFNDINEVYAEFFDIHKPARSLVAVKTLPKNVDIEIEAIALKN